MFADWIGFRQNLIASSNAKANCIKANSLWEYERQADPFHIGAECGPEISSLFLKWKWNHLSHAVYDGVEMMLTINNKKKEKQIKPQAKRYEQSTHFTHHDLIFALNLKCHD